MNKIWFSADLHFNDQNALKYRYRPFENIEEMNEAMIQNWNKYIDMGDTVYFLGDFAIQDEDIARFATRLNFKKIILVIGNHDYKRDRSLLASHFDEIHDEPFELKFDKSYDIHNEGDSLWLCHYPLQRHDELYTCFGHVHDLAKVFKRAINVGVDAWHYRPIELQTILDCRYIENYGHWDANVYIDSDLEWQYKVSTKKERDINGGEPTLSILNKKIIENGKEYLFQM